MRHVAVLIILCLVFVCFAQNLVRITSADLTGEASTTLDDTIVRVTDNGGNPIEGVTIYFRPGTTARTKVFCLPSVTTTNKTGFANCRPLLGFSPGEGNFSASLQRTATLSDLIYKVTVQPGKFVWGWVQISIILGGSVLSILGTIVLAIWIAVQTQGTKKMREVSDAIREGAHGFMKTQYITIGALSVPLAIVLFLLYGVARRRSSADADIDSFIVALIVSASFILGVICSGLAGIIGMAVAVQANIRVADAARFSYNRAVQIAIRSGAFAGFLVVSMSVLGVGALFAILLLAISPYRIEPHQVVSLIVGYSFGASFCALFAQLGGGIFTKAADVGADLVGKVEEDIPEDDLRNPAVIADLVGDNVGDCAGRGADLFESIAAENIGAMILAGTLAAQASPQIVTPYSYIAFPLMIHVFGMLSSWVAIFFVSVRDKKNYDINVDSEDTNNQKEPLLSSEVAPDSSYQQPELSSQQPSVSDNQIKTEEDPEKKGDDLEDPMNALNRGMVVATILCSGFIVLCCFWLLRVDQYPSAWWHFALCGLFGIATSIGFVVITIYYTDYNWAPVQSIIKSSGTGAATNVISGIAVGMESTALPIVMISAVIIASYYTGRSSGIVDAAGRPIGGLFGTAVATMGMLSTATFILAMDVFGPITDNAGGIVEMSQLSQGVRQITDRLDAVGNTTKALTKGYAIGSAALASFLLFSAFMDTITAYSGVEFNVVNLALPETFVGAILGAMLVFLFSSLSIRAVGKTAETIIMEVRRQFREKPGIRTFAEKPDYSACVAIVTRSALVQMIVPGVLAVTLPIALGFIFRFIGYIQNERFMGPQVIAGFLMVATIAGILMALFLNNAGGAWDNAKKAIELLPKYGGKGSATHKAAVVGDTVGDPCKDTAGPSLHVLTKLIATVALVMGPFYIQG